MKNTGTFSPQLVERLRAYFKKEYDKDISPEEAGMFLMSLATVYDALSPRRD